MDQTVLEQSINELHRGTQVMAVLELLKQKQYGYSLLQLLSSQGLSIEAGTLYPLLRRLQAQGLLESTWDTEEMRPRKYYILSEQGTHFLIALKKEWKQLVKKMSRIMKEE
jgi:PadR family transcriptional regulator PadR